jgi:hypothetical protein
MEFLSAGFAFGSGGLRLLQLAENIIPRTIKQIEIEVGLMRSRSLDSRQSFFQVTRRGESRVMRALRGSAVGLTQSLWIDIVSRPC